MPEDGCSSVSAVGGPSRATDTLALPPLGRGHDHVDVAAAAPGADEPLAPLGDGILDFFEATPLVRQLFPQTDRSRPEGGHRSEPSVDGSKPLVFLPGRPG
jgi:hypothetical protein